MWRLVGDLYSCQTRTEFFEVFHTRLHPLIRHDSFACFPINPVTNNPETAGYVASHDDAEKAAHDYGTYYHSLDPLKELNHPSCINRAIKVSDRVTRSEYVNSEFYHDFLKSRRIDTTLGIKLGVDGGYALGGIGLHRAPGSRDFSEREKTILEFLSPHMANALWNIKVRSQLLNNGLPTLQEQILLSGANGVTPREKETAALVVEGFNNGEIAERLNISKHTVKDHVRSLDRKTGAKTRAGLVINLLRRS
jgi:DNA-binding CsgD family transcriptional regulator